MSDRKRLWAHVIDALTRRATRLVAEHPTPATREAAAREIERVTASPLLSATGSQYIRLGWDWADGPRRGSDTRSLAVTVHMLNNSDEWEQLCRVRVRHLTLSDGSPVDTSETLDHLRRELGMNAIPDDLRSFPDAPNDLSTLDDVNRSLTQPPDEDDQDNGNA